MSSWTVEQFHLLSLNWCWHSITPYFAPLATLNMWSTDNWQSFPWPWDRPFRPMQTVEALASNGSIDCTGSSCGKCRRPRFLWDCRINAVKDSCERRFEEGSRLFHLKGTGSIASPSGKSEILGFSFWEEPPVSYNQAVVSSTAVSRTERRPQPSYNSWRFVTPII